MPPTTATSPPTIAVVGSLNVDLVSRAARVPSAGETLTSSSFEMGFGGKGANQATACARLSRPRSPALGAAPELLLHVRMFGAIGCDAFASGFLDSLARDGVIVDGVRTLQGHRTGVAVILVDDSSGENRILVHPGANHALPAAGLVSWPGVSLALFQLEIPLPVVLHTLREARANGASTVLNPAPAVALPDDIYPLVDHLIMNESEAAILSGRAAGDIDIRFPSNLAAVLHHFISLGVKSVVITLGSHGVVYQTFQQPGHKHIPARPVKVVDTTAAGDTFVGAYAVAWVSSGMRDHGASIDLAVAKANEAASLAVQRAGAQSAIPWLDEISGGMQ